MLQLPNKTIGLEDILTPQSTDEKGWISSCRLRTPVDELGFNNEKKLWKPVKNNVIQNEFLESQSLLRSTPRLQMQAPPKQIIVPRHSISKTESLPTL